MEVRGQFLRVNSLSTMGFLWTELTFQAWQQVPLSAEPSSWAKNFLFLIDIYIKCTKTLCEVTRLGMRTHMLHDDS